MYDFIVENSPCSTVVKGIRSKVCEYWSAIEEPIQRTNPDRESGGDEKFLTGGNILARLLPCGGRLIR